MTIKRTRQNSSAVEKGEEDASEIAHGRAAKTSKNSIMSPKSKLKWIKRNRQGQQGRSGRLNRFEKSGTNEDRQPAGSKRMLFQQDMNSEDINISKDVEPEIEGRATLPSSYFAQKASASSKTVAELGISLANESELRAAVAKLPERLPEIKRILFERYKRDVRKMSMEWRAGFSVLLYGYGSKFDLVKMILKESCSGFPAVLIDGLSPRLTYRSILMNILALLRDCKPTNFSSLTDEELFQSIREETANGERVFVFLSNIDGPALRNYRDQRILSEIAAIPNLHFGATIDHVNAPLIWDLQTYDRFSWAWHHTPTFKPYIREVNNSSLPSLFLGRKEACTQESAAVVLSSLSNNAREVFRCIADAQLDPEGVGGITFQSLFNVCKEKFLASNENILKAFLTEFKDHDILQTKKSPDGGNDILTVPLDESSLRSLLSICQ